MTLGYPHVDVQQTVAYAHPEHSGEAKAEDAHRGLMAFGWAPLERTFNVRREGG